MPLFAYMDPGRLILLLALTSFLGLMNHPSPVTAFTTPISQPSLQQQSFVQSDQPPSSMNHSHFTSPPTTNSSLDQLLLEKKQECSTTNYLLRQTTSPDLPDDTSDSILPGTTEVLMYPTWASNSMYDVNDGYHAYIHGVVFKRHKPSFLNRIIIKAFIKHYGSTNPEEKQRLEGRLSYFFADHSKHKTKVSTVDDISLSGSTYRLPHLIPDSDGHFETESTPLPSAPYLPGDIVELQVRLPSSNRPFYGRCHLYGPTGWSILTDIDDTIKDTRVPKYNKMFRKAFMEKYEAIPGMVELFQYLSVKLATQAAPDVGFHYISGTPFSLMPSLDRWLKRSNFPSGPLQLAKFRIKDPSTLYNLPQYVQFKVTEMTRVRRYFPHRKFILFGDSGQGDERAYAQLMKGEGGDSFQCMFIRLVSGVDEATEYELNRLERWITSLSDIPQTRWRLFRDPKELYNIDIAGGKCHPDEDHAAILADMEAQKGMLVSEVTRIINSPALPLSSP
ncbi:MAG: hypothetical protein DHS80DRAFT_21419 [Piptocephalis tieghemiana]|nr:MAG: hypothetical protein DHS80DRAFT_21419 [Piptocephalis tieghemiana]